MTLLHRWPTAAVIALVIFFCLLRFVDLENVPPGFYLDEAAIAAQVICLGDSGHDLHATPWPLFSNVLGGGYATPPFLYLGAAWTNVFGDSVASFRSFTATFGVLFVAASYLFALRLWRTRDAAWLAALCAAVSPWAFQFSRISWDPALAPALLTGALAFSLAEGPRLRLQAALAGLLFALAAYSYPPVRVQIALVVAFLFVWKMRRDGLASLRRLLPLVTTAVVVSAPLLELTLRGDIQRRFQVLSVFNENYLSQFGEPTILAGVNHFFLNFATHFSPSYLFWKGDWNPRHSTYASGEWGGLEILAILVAIGFSCTYAFKKASAPRSWESNPHALRSIGVLAFLSTAAGGALALVWNKHVAWRVVILTVAVAFGGYYYSNYFTRYPQWAGMYFDEEAVGEIKRLISEGRLDAETVEATPALAEYPELSLRYFQQTSGLVKCR
jgi:4-amino-4-deoxy-L-arabinose transferase-like glycosyltransferase